MAESTRVSEEEIARREARLRAYTRPRELLDPFTWTPPYQGAALLAGMNFVGAHIYNIWGKKPWYYGAYPRLAVTVALGLLGFAVGSLREYHFKTRDAVITHYIELHPEDFDHFKDRKES